MYLKTLQYIINIGVVVDFTNIRLRMLLYIYIYICSIEMYLKT